MLVCSCFTACVGLSFIRKKYGKRDAVCDSEKYEEKTFSWSFGSRLDLQCLLALSETYRSEKLQLADFLVAWLKKKGIINRTSV